jgi:hypothetical protein
MSRFSQLVTFLGVLCVVLVDRYPSTYTASLMPIPADFAYEPSATPLLRLHESRDTARSSPWCPAIFAWRPQDSALGIDPRAVMRPAPGRPGFHFRSDAMNSL